MRSLAVVLIAVAALGLGQVSPAARSGQCGLPDATPLWLDYAEGSVSFRNEVFWRPGVIAATSGMTNAADLLARGAQTVYWWMKLTKLAGTPSKPADPSAVAAGVDEVLTKAVAATGCDTPLIVLNELNSAGSTTPLTPANAQYRANVLEIVRGIAARGARPLLLVAAKPYTGGEARDWWLGLGEAADIVREVYFPAPTIMRAGVTLGSRTMRRAFREGVAPLLGLGLRPERLGLVIGFQSGLGKGGREGLRPTSAWLRFTKLQTLAAKQVAGELRLGSIVSWGWGTFDQAGADPDKARAACVYLWSRDEALCDGPALAGPGFDASREEGQIVLPPGVRCSVDGRVITSASLDSLAAVTGDSNVALSVLFATLVEAIGHPVGSPRVLDIERSIIDVRFRGQRAAYRAALRARGATEALAREVIAGWLRRDDVARRFRVAVPTAAEVALYHGLYGDLPARRVRTSTTPSWLDGRRRGYALVPPAPAQVLSLETGSSTPVVTSEGAVTVTALDEVVPLGILPLAVADDAVTAALLAQARARAFQAWSVRAQGRALSRARCAGDAMPAATTVDVASVYLPFLALDA